jgi:hypothetical protein
LRARAAAELAHIDRVAELSANATWLVGWQPEAPVGAARARVGGGSSRALMHGTTMLRRRAVRVHTPITAARGRWITLDATRPSRSTAPDGVARPADTEELP